MEFQGIDALIPAGNGITFVLSDTGEDYLAPACGTACTVHVLPSLSEVTLPIVDRESAPILIVPSPIEE